MLFTAIVPDLILTMLIVTIKSIHSAMPISVGMETGAADVTGIAELVQAQHSMNVQCVIQNIITMATGAVWKLANGREYWV